MPKMSQNSNAAAGGKSNNVVILATAGYDHSIRFWEAPSGICYRTVQYQDSQINCLEITPDKKYLAAAGNPAIRLFDVNSNNPNPVTSYDGHSGNVTAVGFEEVKGNWMYSASEDGTIKIWDFRAKGCQRDIDLKAPINAAKLHPNQVEIFTGDQNGQVSKWDLTANKCSWATVPDNDSHIQSISISATGDLAAAGGSRGSCFAWDPSKPDGMHEFKAHDGYVLDCKISKNGQYVATASSDKTVKVWNTDDYSHVTTLQGHQRWVWSCAFSADSQYIVTASSDHSARLWDLKTGEVFRHYTGHSKAVTCVALNDSSSVEP